MPEFINNGKTILAIIIHNQHSEDGVHFFTPDDFSQQLAVMTHPKDKVILPHVHNHVVREIIYTQEVLVIKRGKLRVDFYDEDKAYLESRVLQSGDVILLASGGHGFKVIEDIEMIEIKQGPYVGEMDKIRFEPVSDEKIVVPDC